MGATQRLEETQSQLDNLQTQHDSQAPPDEASIEDLELKIAEETHSISSLAQQVLAPLDLLLCLEAPSKHPSPLPKFSLSLLSSCRTFFV